MPEIRVVKVEKVIEVLKDLGVCNATEKYFEGWNGAIEGAIASVKNLDKLEGFTIPEEEKNA